MDFATVRGTGYVLAHTPDMILEYGSTAVNERISHPDGESDYLKNGEKFIRSFEDAVNYPANQVYIGNKHYSELKAIEMPWYKNPVEGDRFAPGGEIMPQLEFYGLLEISDSFELVHLEESFGKKAQEALLEHELFKDDAAEMKQFVSLDYIKDHIENYEAAPLYHEGELVGCINRAHDSDPNLTSHVMAENLVAKASGILAMNNMLKGTDIDPSEIDYVIECSEEACGDINQRGGGNFAKAIAEVSKLTNSTGSDLRGFCAAPVHALIAAASMVKAGTHKNVAVVAGGSTAKLGMNGKSHISKDVPILEDCVAGFAFVISENDGVSPVIRTDLTGAIKVGDGSSPQATMKALTDPILEGAGLKITDIDGFATELQNPDITEPGGAGNVPEANLKMIGALGVMGGDLQRDELNDFVADGIPGWAPTQGHIPSGVPYLAFAKQDLVDGDMDRVLMIGKGSLFLGRLTNLFDGVSVLIERNSGEVSSGSSVSVDDELKSIIKDEVASALRGIAGNL